MSIKIRGTLTTQNTALDTSKDIAFPDNNNKEITAAILRTWLDELIAQVQDIIDSYFNKLDELRITSTLAFDDGSTATDWTGSVFPAFQGDVNNQLAQRLTVFESTTYSNDVAFVSDNGNNATGGLGNLSKTFLTINAAIAAVPINGIVKVLGGSYAEVIVLNKQGVTLDITGCSISGRVAIQASNVCIIATNATITNNSTASLLLVSSGTHNNFKLVGGLWDGLGGESLDLDSKLTGVLIRFATFNSNKSGVSVNIIGAKDSIFSNCNFLSNSANVGFQINIGNTSKCVLNKCNIITGGTGINLLDSKLEMRECEVIGGTNGITSSVSVGFIADVIANSCKIVGGSGFGIRFSRICDNVQVTNTKISGGTNTIEYLQASRSAGVTNIFQNNIYYAGSGNIFINNAPVEAPATASTEVLGGTFNKAAAVTTDVNISTTTLTVFGLQDIN